MLKLEYVQTARNISVQFHTNRGNTKPQSKRYEQLHRVPLIQPGGQAYPQSTALLKFIAARILNLIIFNILKCFIILTNSKYF